MKKLALAAATVAVTFVATAGATGPGLTPHVYSTQITGSTIPPLNATWKIALLAHSFTLSRNGAGAVAGSLQVVGNRIILHDVGGQFACTGAQITGTYGWHLSGSRLTLTRFSDQCVGRRTVLSHPFTRIA